MTLVSKATRVIRLILGLLDLVEGMIFGAVDDQMGDVVGPAEGESACKQANDLFQGT